MDEKSLDPVLNHLTNEEQWSLEKYIRSEIMLFGIGSIVISMAFAGRMLVSVWRQYNSQRM
jgi:hypothetical protein